MGDIDEDWGPDLVVGRDRTLCVPNTYPAMSGESPVLVNEVSKDLGSP